MPKGQLSAEEKAEVETRKRHKSINQSIRGARGTTLEVPIGTTKANAAMGQFVRQSTGRSNGKDDPGADLRRRIAGVAKGIIYEADGVTVKYDFSKEMEE